MKKVLLWLLVLTMCVSMVASFSLVGCKKEAAPAEEEAVEEAAEEVAEPIEEVPKDTVTIRMLMEDVPDTRVIEALLPEFTEATGIKVEFEIVQYLDMHQKLVTNFMSPTGNYDVVEVDNYWAGEFPATGWIIPLDDYIKKDNFDTSVYVPATMDLVGYYPMTGTEKQVYMIPLWSYPMGLIYRTDIMNDPALQTAYKDTYNKDLKVPTDLEELVELSKFMQENSGIYGSSMQGGRGDSNVMEWSNYLYSVGGTYYDDNWNATVNDAKGLKAAELYKDSINNTAPEGALNFNFDDAFRVFTQGKAFLMVTHTFIIPLLEDPEQSKVIGKYALVPVPGKNRFKLLDKLTLRLFNWLSFAFSKYLSYSDVAFCSISKNSGSVASLPFTTNWVISPIDDLL